MIIARVTGHIVATAKNPSYTGHKILRLLPEDHEGHPIPGADPIVAIDLVDAGTGDRVLVCQEGRWAREAVGNLDAPVRSTIVGVIERIEVSLPDPPPSPTAT